LVVVAIILLTGKEQRTLQIRLGAVGILLALLVLTKVNLGLFFGIAVTIALLGFSRFRGRRALQIALILIAAALPFILFRDYLQFGWLRMSMVVAAGVISAGIISRTTDDVENAITLAVSY
jgi:4-amino-4-deoxy-L-arabinose transferase-like glycosyltransferase